MKRIIIAPDSFKESLDAQHAAAAIAAGFQNVFPALEMILIPMADGGEGMVRTLVDGTGGRLLKNRVTGPLGRPVDACWGILGDEQTCVIEMAAASGLPLVPPQERNPMITTTYGTGELIRHALATNCKRIIVGIGGSATNDGGAGMAQALGARLLDADGREIGYGARGVGTLFCLDIGQMDPRLKDVDITVAVDVKNPLCGPNGASYVYAPQKGATPEMLPVLDEILRHYAKIIQRDLKINVADVPGSGAAGGLGAGLLAFLGADAKPGIDVVLDVVGMEAVLQSGVDLVVTGEGEINQQTAFGKVPVGVARLAQKHGVPVVALVGSIGEGARAVLDCGIDAYFSLVPRPMTLSECMEHAEALLTDLAEQCARMLQAFWAE
ncbi:MAG: glycerate kinase [Bacillota bacterium]|nr:glycerate kinase [Bacillota bacterium]